MAQPRARVGIRTPSVIVVAAIAALVVGLAALVVGITTWPGLLLASTTVTIDLVILQQHPVRWFRVAGSTLGVVLLVGILALASILVTA